jgi:hypothetical protein
MLAVEFHIEMVAAFTEPFQCFLKDLEVSFIFFIGHVLNLVSICRVIELFFRKLALFDSINDFEYLFFIKLRTISCRIELVTIRGPTK